MDKYKDYNNFDFIDGMHSRDKKIETLEQSLVDAKEELADEKEEVGVWKKISTDWKTKYLKSEIQLEAIGDWAKDKHPEWCGHFPKVSDKCTCGLDELLQKEGK